MPIYKVRDLDGGAWIDQLFTRLSGALTSKRGYFERFFYSCCYVVISSPDEIEAERKLAKLFSSIVIAAKSNPVIVQIVRQLGNRFISGHFLSLESINQNIEELLSKK
mgnify:CR=1 FL=1